MLIPQGPGTGQPDLKCSTAGQIAFASADTGNENLYFNGKVPEHLTVNFSPARGYSSETFFPAPGHLSTKILPTPRKPGGMVGVRIERDMKAGFGD